MGAIGRLIPAGVRLRMPCGRARETVESGDVLRAASVNGERTSAFNTRQKGVLALPPDALLRVARCSAHAACAPNMMLKRNDSLQLVGRSR